MKRIDQNNQVQVESLLNECKGNLFEFLVAQKLSHQYKNEDLFLLSLPRDFKVRLQFYEETIRLHDSELLRNLSLLASAVVENLEQHEVFANNNSFSFAVIGKMVATNDNELWNETDIVALEKLPDGSQKKHFLSLKLTKYQGYTNTKSAGIKSFLDKYFSGFNCFTHELQLSLNQYVDESFYMMGHKLYSMIDQNFTGSFDTNWSQTQTELPGELEPEMKEVVHENYYRVAQKIHEFLCKMHSKDPHLFYMSLHALSGFGNPDIIQVSCFHQNDQLKVIKIKTLTDMFSGNYDEISLKNLNHGVASFDISFKKFVLQIRVKPMNKFTTAAYKINCSIKMVG